MSKPSAFWVRILPFLLSQLSGTATQAVAHLDFLERSGLRFNSVAQVRADAALGRPCPQCRVELGDASIFVRSGALLPVLGAFRLAPFLWDWFEHLDFLERSGLRFNSVAQVGLALSQFVAFAAILCLFGISLPL